jgi:hypothetical protein
LRDVCRTGFNSVFLGTNCHRKKFGAAVRLIINADDLGHSEPINATILKFVAQGAVTSATLIANAPAADRALKAMAAFPQCSLGVHLNLDEFRPLTNSIYLQPLLRPDGSFEGNAIRRSRITPQLASAIYTEWSAQVGYLASVGRLPSHVDSHHHVHTIPLLLPVLKLLQRRFNIRKVRLTKNLYGPGNSVSSSLAIAKAFWNASLRSVYRTTTTDAFTSLLEFYEIARTGKLKDRLRQERSTVELMTHPGSIDYETETQLLSADWARNAGFRLISYSELCSF